MNISEIIENIDNTATEIEENDSLTDDLKKDIVSRLNSVMDDLENFLNEYGEEESYEEDEEEEM